MKLEEMPDQMFRDLALRQFEARNKMARELKEFDEMLLETSAEMLRRWGNTKISNVVQMCDCGEPLKSCGCSSPNEAKL